MRIITTLLLLLSTFCLFAQLPYQKDKKWGISRDGTGEKTDSIIHRAEFDKLELKGDVIYVGLKNDEWQLLTSNRMVNQQRYESIEVPYFVDGQYAVCSRTGYIDIISIENADFVARSVQADEIVNPDNSVSSIETLILTKKGDYFGIVNAESKKEILKANYLSVLTNSENEQYPLIALTENSNLIFDLEGKELFKIPTIFKVIEFEGVDDIPNCFNVIVQGKKGAGYGFYDAENKWIIQPEYTEWRALDNTSDAIVVSGKKGDGLYFQGKQILDCMYLEIEKSDKRGFVAKATDKKGVLFYVTPEGKLKQLPNE